MSKIRVDELAQKLGLDNKVLLERLHQAGVQAKSHTTVLEESDVKKLEAASAPPAGKVDEERINVGIIRRRRKETPAAEVEAVAVAEEAVVTAPVGAVKPVLSGLIVHDVLIGDGPQNRIRYETS